MHFNNGKMNIAGLSDDLNGVKLERVMQIRI